MHIPFLEPGNHRFPDPRPALEQTDGLVCVSADLAPARLLAAYPRGIFPWFSQDNLHYWFATAPRAVIEPDALHIGRSLHKHLRNKPYRVTANRCFAQVIAACAAAPRPGDTRHLLWLRERLGERLADAVVVTTGRHAYRDEDDVAVVPAALLGP